MDKSKKRDEKGSSTLEKCDANPFGVVERSDDGMNPFVRRKRTKREREDEERFMD